jgi:hypothetical protein
MVTALCLDNRAPYRFALCLLALLWRRRGNFNTK